MNYSEIYYILPESDLYGPPNLKPMGGDTKYFKGIGIIALEPFVKPARILLTPST